MRELLLATAVVLAFAGSAHAQEQPQPHINHSCLDKQDEPILCPQDPLIDFNLATASDIWPASITKYKKNFGEGSCTEHATGVAKKLDLENIDLVGTSVQSSTKVVQGRVYTVLIRCDVDAHVGIFVVVIGNFSKEAGYVLEAVEAVWQGQQPPHPPLD